MNDLWLRRRRVSVSLVILLCGMALLCGAQTLNISAKGKAAIGKEAMVTTAHPLASNAAIEMLQRGGNAVDAAVAAAFAIGVVEPDGSGLGGGGGMVIYLKPQNKSVYINFYPRASERITDVSYARGGDSKSAKSILVPGNVAGLAAALEQFGTLPLSVVLEPAIRYAENGFAIDETLAKIILDNSEMIQASPTLAATYLREGFPLTEGDTIYQRDLARTLRAIAEEGRKGFYEGPIARQMVDDVTKNGGALTMEDLRSTTAEVMEPIHGTYRGYEIITAGLPQSGATVVETLNILENEDLRKLGPFTQSAESFHLIAEAMRRAYADRQAFIGDPNFVYCPLQGLTSKEFAQDRFSTINRSAVDPPEYRKTKAGNPLPYDSTASKKGPAVKEESDQSTGRNDKNDTLRADPERNMKEHEARRLPDAPPLPGRAATPRSSLVHSDSDPTGASTPDSGGHTTHLSVIDKDGNVVSLTQTLGTFFGSGLVSAGVLFNNALSNFSLTGSDNLIQARKQPRSSISPTIILKDGKTWMAVGSPGATRIPATVVQLIVNVIDFGMSADEANNAPRFFCQKTDEFLHLESRFSEEIREALKKKGHKLQVYGDFDLFFGGAQIILVDSATGVCYGSADPRRGGVAIGY